MNDERPHDAERVKERFEDLDSVHQVGYTGPGLTVAYKNDRNEIRQFSKLAEKGGWYVASYEARDDGDVAVLMPFPGGDLAERYGGETDA